MGRGYQKIARRIRNQPGYSSILGCDAPGSRCTHCTRGKKICYNSDTTTTATTAAAAATATNNDDDDDDDEYDDDDDDDDDDND